MLKEQIWDWLFGGLAFLDTYSKLLYSWTMEHPLLALSAFMFIGVMLRLTLVDHLIMRGVER